jgi:hypothetical protein
MGGAAFTKEAMIMRTYWHYRCISIDGVGYYQVGLNADGSLYNPRGYPNEAELRAELERIVEERKAEERERRSAGAKRGAETRARRRARLVWQIAQRMVRDEKIGPCFTCIICGRELSDPQSIARGIGSECWQDVLTAIEQVKTNSTTTKRWEAAS